MPEELAHAVTEALLSEATANCFARGIRLARPLTRQCPERHVHSSASGAILPAAAIVPMTTPFSASRLLLRTWLYAAFILACLTVVAVVVFTSQCTFMRSIGKARTLLITLASSTPFWCWSATAVAASAGLAAAEAWCSRI